MSTSKGGSVLDKFNFIESIPENQKHRIRKIKYEKDEFLYYNEKNTFGVVLEGVAVFVRYQDDQEFFYPWTLRSGDVLGVGRYFDKGDWEITVYSKTLLVLEIPEDLMEKYLLSNPDFYISLMKKRDHFLNIGIRGFFIRLHGGVKAYLAYLLFLYSEGSNIVSFNKYIDIMKMLFSNKAMLYRVTRELIEENIIIKERKRIVIINRSLLKAHFEDFIYE